VAGFVRQVLIGEGVDAGRRELHGEIVHQHRSARAAPQPAVDDTRTQCHSSVGVR
jgi:hypothetical protein